jgi:hypothetical protein
MASGYVYLSIIRAYPKNLGTSDEWLFFTGKAQ